MNERTALLAALNWHLDQGVDEALEDRPIDRLVPIPLSPVGRGESRVSGEGEGQITAIRENAESEFIRPSPNPLPTGERALLPPVKSELLAEANKLAREANTLEDLRQAITDFEGIAIKKTATNLVFSDGNPKAQIMLVGEAPGADEDRMGKPFVGVSGQLLDRILKFIDLDRKEDDPLKSIYISNILSWRPPGNRTPSPAEAELSLPFIEKHIALIQPKILILCGGVSAKALLASEDGISKLRKGTRMYKTLTPDLGVSVSIPAIATYHPAYLLRTPSQKRAVWEDMLTIDAKRRQNP